MAITKKQRIFIDEYLKCFNATRAAIAAGYSERSARAQGSRLLTYDDIKAEVVARLEESAMSADEVVSRLGDIARGDITDLMDVSTMGFSINLLNDYKDKKEQTKLIRKLKQKVTTIQPRSGDGEEKEIIETEIELYSALDALKLLGQKHAMFRNITEHTGKDGNPMKIEVEYVNAPYPDAGVSSGTGDNSSESE